MSAISVQITKLTLFCLLAIINCKDELATTQPDLSQGIVTNGQIAISTNTKDEQEKAKQAKILKLEEMLKMSDHLGEKLQQSLTNRDKNAQTQFDNGISKMSEKSRNTNKVKEADIWQSTGKLTSDGVSVATGVGRAVGNLTMGTLDRVAGFRKTCTLFQNPLYS